MNKYALYDHAPGQPAITGPNWAAIAQDLEDMAAALEAGTSMDVATPFTSALVPLYALARLHRERGR